MWQIIIEPVLSNKFDKRFVYQFRMRWHCIEGRFGNQMVGNTLFNAARHQIQGKNSRRSVPASDTVNVDIAVAIANSIVNRINTSGRRIYRNHNEIFNRNPVNPRKGSVERHKLIRRFATLTMCVILLCCKSDNRFGDAKRPCQILRVM